MIIHAKEDTENNAYNSHTIMSMSIELATNKIEEYANSKTVQRGVLQFSKLPISQSHIRPQPQEHWQKKSLKTDTRDIRIYTLTSVNLYRKYHIRYICHLNQTAQIIINSVVT